MGDWDVVSEAPVAAAPAAPTNPWEVVSEAPTPQAAQFIPDAQRPEGRLGQAHDLIAGYDTPEGPKARGWVAAIAGYPTHFVKGMLEQPKAAFEVSEKLRTEGEMTPDDAGTMAGAAMMGGVKLGKTVGKGGAPTPEERARIAEKPVEAPVEAPVAPEWKPVSETPVPEGITPPTSEIKPLAAEKPVEGITPAEPPPVPPERPAAPEIRVDEDAVLARIGRQPKEGLPTATDLYTDFVDNLHPIKKAVEAATDGAPLETSLNPYEQFRLTRGSAGKAEHMLRHGTLDFKTLEKNGGGLEEILKPVMKERNELSAYMLSKRAIELNERGIDTGIPLESAQRVAAAGEARYAGVAQKLDEFQSRTLDYARDSGLLSPEAVDAMRNASKHYLPLYRVMEPGAKGGQPSRFKPSNPVKRLEGSERQILDPLESVIRNTYVLAEMAERNRASQALVNFAKDHPDSALAVKTSPSARPVRIHETEVARMMDDMGIPRDLYGDPKGFEVFRKVSEGLKPDEIAVYENGKREVYRTDPEIAKIIQGLDQDQVGLVMRMMAKPASWLRAGVVADPGYMARNIVRDQLNAAVQSPNGYRPFVDFAKGLFETAKQGDQFKAWLKSGGSQSSMVAQDRNYASKFVKKYGQDPTTGQIAKNVVNKPIELLRELSETIDNATRVGEFMRSTKGKTDVESVMKGGMASRDVTQDFQRLGAKTKGMNQITAFMNGQIQGLDREITNLIKRPAPSLAKIAAYITVPSVYIWMAGKDDPRYQNAPNWEKDSYWLIMPEDPKAEPIRVPKPFTIGQVFGSSMERTLDAYFKDKPDAYKGFAKQVLGTVTPNVIPTAAAPVIEQFANRSLFTDAPLVGQRLDKLMPEKQAGTTTSGTAKLVGKGVAKIPGMDESKLASPIILDNYVRGWGGTLGKYGTMTADKGLAALGLVDKVGGPTRKLSDIPMLRSFISNYPSAGAQPIKDFYEENAKVEKLFAGQKADRKKDPDAEVSGSSRVQGFKKKLDALQRTVRETHEDRYMPATEKRETIDAAYMEMLDVAQQGLKFIREARKAK